MLARRKRPRRTPRHNAGANREVAVKRQLREPGRASRSRGLDATSRCRGRTAEKLEKTVENSGESGIMKQEGVNGLEQAKKRDKKIYITEQAINKVDYVQPSDFTPQQALSMQQKNKELLRIAKTKNHSNEVLFIEDLQFNSFPDGEIIDKSFVKQFLSRCKEGGIEYVKAK